jgi:transcriptional regulator with XRE-family HTH domain
MDQEAAQDSGLTTAQKIRQLRESRQFSQDYVAAKLNISQQMYSRMESNPEDAPLRRIRQLSEVLEVPLSTIIGGDDMYVQQNYHQQGGNAGTVMYVHGSSESERKAYEQHVADLRKQIALLEKLILRG